jgi:hypothetical protein
MTAIAIPAPRIESRSRTPRSTNSCAQSSACVKSNACSTDTTKIKPGDIIGFSSHDLAGVLINLASWGVPFYSISHVGIMAPWGEDVLFWESTCLNGRACEIQRRRINGVQAHKLESRLDGFRGKVWHYPLAQPLTEGQAAKLTRFLSTKIGIGYDYIGAFRSAGTVFSWAESCLRKENLHSLFCSELCAAAHDRLGIFDIENASRFNPNNFVRTERRAGVLLEPIRLK